KNLVLIGMRGSGKTAVGKVLAKFLDFKFVDIDAALEKNAGSKISEIVAKNGWDFFRELETQWTKKFAAEKNLVISTGGGVILKKENVRALKKNGIVIFVDTPLELLQKRVAQNSKRPSLTGDDPAQELAKVWAEREKLYRAAADITVFFDFETKNKKTDLIRKSKLIWKAVKDFSQK
ncbi:MAG: shikimate kinase, partial [Patescibacteria group bacterium]